MATETIPPLQPQPGRYNALAVLPVDQTSQVALDARWLDGFQFRAEACPGNGGVLPPNCLGTTSAMSTTLSTPLVDGSGFVIYALDKCSTIGYAERDYEARARRQLESQQSYFFANELWTGAKTGPSSGIASPTNRPLADPAAETLGSGAVNPDVALPALDEYGQVCNRGRRFFIHATPQLLATWATNGQIRREGALWLSPNDGIIVADGGYTGSAPGSPGTPPTTTQYAYVTSYMQAILGPVEVFGGPNAQGVIRSTNDVVTWAWRPMMWQWDECCHGAIQVTLDITKAQ